MARNQGFSILDRRYYAIGEKARPNPFGYLCGTWKPRNLPLRKGKQVARRTEKIAGIGNGKKRTLCCNDRDTVLKH